MGTSRSEVVERISMKGECNMRKKLSLILTLNLFLCIGVIAVSGVAYAAAGNSQYSLSGTQYQLYTDDTCTEEAADADGNNAVLTTDADGNANTLRMNPGIYYAREVSAGKGYRPGTEVYTVEVTASDTSAAPAVFTALELPAFSTPEFTVFLKDASGSSDLAGLTGAVFTVRYYDVKDKSEIAGTVPKDQWTFETVKKEAPDKVQEGTFWAGFDWQNDDPVSSTRPDSDLFCLDGDGRRALPLGWLTIEETAAPEGFMNSDRICYCHIYIDSSGNPVTEFEESGASSSLQTNAVIFENEPDPHIAADASVQKNNSEVMDVIKYEDLIRDQEYVLKGWLVDTATGEKVPGSDGSVSISTENSSSGQVDMILKTAAYDEMQGNSMTAFEELYIVRENEGESEEIQVTDHRDGNGSDRAVEIYQDLKVQNNVTGNLGDITKAFLYTAEFTGLEPGKAYTVEGYDSKVFNADQSGNATIPFKLVCGKSVTIKQLPKGAKYRITEEPSDHVAGFRIFSEDMEDKGAKILKASGSNEDASKGLSTEFETVDLLDGTVVVLWENNRDLATITAVQSYFSIWAFAMIPVLAGLMMLIKKHNRYREE